MDGMEKELRKLRRSMCITRVFCVVPALLFIIIIVGGAYLWGEVSGIVDRVLPAVEAMGEVEWEQLANSLNEIDTAQLNQAVGNLNDAADAIKKITSIFQ